MMRVQEAAHRCVWSEDTIMTPRAFISFEMEDRWARDFLVQHAHDKRTDIDFVDYSVQDRFDSSWKTKCAERIAKTKGTIVLVGATTHKSSAVQWEIAETNRLGHHIFGIQINSDDTAVVPVGVNAANVVRWDFAQIVKKLELWV